VHRCPLACTAARCPVLAAAGARAAARCHASVLPSIQRCPLGSTRPSRPPCPSAGRRQGTG